MAANVLHSVALWASKAPILLLYVELFGVKRWLRYSSYTTLVLRGVLMLVAMSMTFEACNLRVEVDGPHRFRCSKRLVVAHIVSGLASLTADIIILCLPLHAISQLNLPLPKKIGLGVIFTSGIL